MKLLALISFILISSCSGDDLLKKRIAEEKIKQHQINNSVDNSDKLFKDLDNEI